MLCSFERRATPRRPSCNRIGTLVHWYSAPANAECSRTLNTQVLERTVRERDDELRDARPRVQALEAELASMRDETDGLRKANAKLKGHLGTVRRSLQIDLSPEAMSDL